MYGTTPDKQLTSTGSYDPVIAISA